MNRDAVTATRKKLLRNEEQRFIDEVARCANQLQEQQPWRSLWWPAPTQRKENTMTLSEQELYDAFHLMKEMGGGFASRLADAWFYADSRNRSLIETTWYALVVKYSNMAEQRK